MNERQIGLRKVVALAQERAAGKVGGRVRDAVPDVEAGGRPTLSEAPPGAQRCSPMLIVERDDRDLHFADKKATGSPRRARSGLARQRAAARLMIVLPVQLGVQGARGAPQSLLLPLQLL